MTIESRPAAVHLHGVRFAWSTKGPDCLDVPDFRVEAGERIFIQGPSGSGKSTLLSLIAGVISPQQGRVEVLGQDLDLLRSAARDRFRALHVGFIFQLFNLIPYLSALDNILLPCRFAPARAARLAGPPRDEAVRLATRLDLDADVLVRPASDLSVGQQQRVAAARALIGRPGVVIADEPTSALDADRQRAFLDLLLGECADAGAALLFVSHDDRLQDRFDRAIRLHDINRAVGEGART